jgi:general secretion pathway protein J
LQGWQLYFFRDNAWSNPLSSAGGNSGQPVLPDAVRSVIELAPDSGRGSITLDWLRPNWSVGRS